MADYEIDAEAPLDPAAERLRRKLVRLLLGSGLIMMLGLIAVFVAIVYKAGLLGSAGQGGAGTFAVAGHATVPVPAGARLIAAELDRDKALLHLQTAEGGSALLLVDLRSGSVLGRYDLQGQ